MIYGTKLPRYSGQQSDGDCCRNCCYLLSLILSILAHLLFYWLFINSEDKHPAVPSGRIEKSIEVTLSAAPKLNPSPAQKPSQPVPSQPKPSQPKPPQPTPLPTPKPIPKPKETKPEKQPIRKPIPKRPEPPIPVFEPEPPKPRKPVVKPKPEKENLPEFKDDFAELSKDYSHHALETQGSKSLGNNPEQSDNGVHTGSILNINPRIHYPLQAQRQGMHGMVVVLIHIAPDGSTDGVDLLQSSGYDELDNEVLGAVQHWRFKPPMRGNTPVEGVYKHRVIFGADENVTDDFETRWREIELQPAAK